jgi:hypothetical protein
MFFTFNQIVSRGNLSEFQLFEPQWVYSLRTDTREVESVKKFS